MKKQYSIMWLMAVAFAATFTFTACSSDDDDNTNNDSEKFETTNYDDLDYFQRAIVDVDSLGNFKYRQYGTPLYENDTTHLYLGVETLEAAEQFFRQWLAPDIKAVAAADKSLTVNLTDEQGKAQGTVYFRPGTGGTVAEVTVSPETKLRHFSQVTFLLNSAWPFNSATSKWHVGDIVHNLHYANGLEDYCEGGKLARDWVCIRESSNGVKPMFCAISKQAYGIPFGLTDSRSIKKTLYCPSLPTAETIKSLLNKDWDFFAACFDECGGGKLLGDGYWIDDVHNNGWSIYTEVYYYNSGFHYGERGNESVHKHFLLKIDWVEDGNMHDGGTY